MAVRPTNLRAAAGLATLPMPVHWRLQTVRPRALYSEGPAPTAAETNAKPYLRAAVQEVFVGGCDAGEAGAAALLLECDGIDGNEVRNPGYVRPAPLRPGLRDTFATTRRARTATPSRHARPGAARAKASVGAWRAARPTPTLLDHPSCSPSIRKTRRSWRQCGGAALCRRHRRQHGGKPGTCVRGKGAVKRGGRHHPGAGGAGGATAAWCARWRRAARSVSTAGATPNRELPLVQAIVSKDAACMEACSPWTATASRRSLLPRMGSTPCRCSTSLTPPVSR